MATKAQIDADVVLTKSLATLLGTAIDGVTYGSHLLNGDIPDTGKTAADNLDDFTEEAAMTYNAAIRAMWDPAKVVFDYIEDEGAGPRLRYTAATYRVLGASTSGGTTRTLIGLGTDTQINIGDVSCNPVVIFDTQIIFYSASEADTAFSFSTGAIRPGAACDAYVLPEFTVGTLPTAATYQGGMIMVTDETGGYVPAFSDGTNWRRVTDRAVVS